MLVIPVSDGLKKQFPFVTLGLILINCLVFFIFQGNENEGYRQAFSYSHSSGLFKIESQLYTKFLETSQKQLPVALQRNKNSAAYFWHMMQDDEFQYELRHQTLIPPADPQFSDWLAKRQLFEKKLNLVFSHRFGYSPARKNYPAAFTCMFLHGGIMHLLGNMIFLWFVGALLEIGIGRWCYLGGYLFTGVCASLAFGLVYPITQGPLVGASGAIAGLMGAYGLIYGRARIKVFYSLGFYFDYATVPGWILFPFWLGNEFFQLFTNSGSNVAYMAHVGGLVSGGSLAFAYLAKKGNRAAEILEEDASHNQVPLLLEQGLDYFSELKLTEARAKVVEALEIEPHNLVALSHLFNIDKCSPQSELFHTTALQLLNHLKKQKESGELEVYFEEYKQLSGAPRLQPDLVFALAMSYVHSGKTAEAARFLTLLLKKQPQYPGLPLCLYNLATVYEAANKTKQSEKCLRLLCSRYPQTSSGRKAAERLNSFPG